VTLLLADQDRRPSRPPIEHFSPCLPALGPFRAAVSDLVAEVAQAVPADPRHVERILSRRLDGDDFAAVLDATPDGRSVTVARLLFEVRNYEPTTLNATGTLASLVRISMLAQIEAVWWGRAPSYQSDSDVRDAAELVDLDEVGDTGQLRFCYRHQATTLAARAARSAERRALPGRSPRTAGVWLPKARPELVAWLNDIADEFSQIAPDRTPPLWVTSVTRSVEHQLHLKSLGYIAPLPSTHCVGYAADIEMKWYRRFRAHRILRGLLLDRQRAGEVNVIDEGQAWHVCLRPDAISSIGGFPGVVPPEQQRREMVSSPAGC
jgi:hypothetical protein